MSTKRLTIPESATSAIASIRGDNLPQWIVAFGEAEVAGSPKNRQLFLDYFIGSLRSDSIDDWTKSVTKGLSLGSNREQTTGDRTHRLRLIGFWRLFGIGASGSGGVDRFWPAMPFEAISDLATDDPPVLGVSPLQEKRLYDAADKLQPSTRGKTNNRLLRIEQFCLRSFTPRHVLRSFVDLVLCSMRGNTFEACVGKGE